jgi:hypothetical protein
MIQLTDIWSLQEDNGTYFLTVNTTNANKRLVNTANNVAGNVLPPNYVFYGYCFLYATSKKITKDYAVASTQCK